MTDLAAILEQLGNSAEQVAEALRGHGVNGVRNTVRFLNPVVRYVHPRAKLPGAAFDLMKKSALTVTMPDGKKHRVQLPEAVCEFLKAFDRGDYPDLEEPV